MLWAAHACCEATVGLVMIPADGCKNERANLIKKRNRFKIKKITKQISYQDLLGRKMWSQFSLFKYLAADV